MPKRIAKLRVDFISLVDEPANRKPIIYKSKSRDGMRQRVDILFSHLRKNSKKGLVFGVVYEPNTVDTQGDWADAETIEKASHDFVGSGKVRQVDMHHDEVAGKGTVIESFILHGEDSRFPGVKKGAWCVVIKVADEFKGRMNEIGGLSLQGIATYKSKSAGAALADDEDEQSSDEDDDSSSPAAKSRFTSTTLAKSRFRSSDHTEVLSKKARARFN